VWAALLWLGPALLLIVGVVVFPAVQLVRAAFSRYSITGLRLGDAGTANFSNVLNHGSLATVLTNTVIWVVVVVALTVLVSLAVIYPHKLKNWADSTQEAASSSISI